jgi:mannose-6-phosphate isomerase-like protein (cupin superfamily)
MELDERRVNVQVGDCVVIPPQTRHRAVGAMTVLIIAYPKFDPADEWFD